MRLGTFAAAFALAWSTFAVTLLIFSSATFGSYFLVPYRWHAPSEQVLLWVSYWVTALGCGRYAVIAFERPNPKGICIGAAVATAVAVLVLWPALSGSVNDVVKFVAGSCADKVAMSLVPVAVAALALKVCDREPASWDTIEVEPPETTTSVLGYWRGPVAERFSIRYVAAVILTAVAVGAAIRFSRHVPPIAALPTYLVLSAQILFLMTIPLIVLGSTASLVARSSKVLVWALVAGTIAAAGIITIVT